VHFAKPKDGYEKKEKRFLQGGEKNGKLNKGKGWLEEHGYRLIFLTFVNMGGGRWRTVGGGREEV